MKQTITIGWVLVLATALVTNAGFSQGSMPVRHADKMGLRAANDQFYAALNSMFKGDLAPMNAIWSHKDDVSNQGPFGDRMDGWAAVGAEFKKEAGMKLGGRVVCKNVIVRAGKDWGYTVTVEQGENMSAEGKPVTVLFRATNIFRLENGKWKLIHHHTDLSPPLQKAVGTERE